MLRRLTAWILALAVLSAEMPAGAAVCVTGPGFAALVDESGEILANGALEDAFVVREGALYAAGSRGDYRLYDASGAVVCDEVFDMIRDAGDCLIFRRGERFGAMDLGGSVIVAPVWTQLTSNGAGGFLALDGDPLDDGSDGIIFIDADGEIRRSAVSVAGGLTDVSDGRMPYMASDGRWGAVDAEGRGAIAASWRWIGAFSGGVAAAEGESGRGMIDAEGNAVIEAGYSWLDRGETMIAALGAEGVDVFAPDASALRFSLSGEGLQCALTGPYLSVTSAEWNRLYDAQGALICAADAGSAFYPGLDGQFILAEGAWGEACQRLIDADGTPVSDALQRILPLTGGRYAWLKMPGTAYYSADLGGVQKSWDYGAARWGLMDGEGNILTGAEYVEISVAGADRLLLRTEGEIILSDPNGHAVRRWPATGEAPNS